jgi:hypothetical protein
MRKIPSLLITLAGPIGTLISGIALVITLREILHPPDYVFVLLVGFIGVLAGIFSKYIARTARKLQAAPRVFISYSRLAHAVGAVSVTQRITDELRRHGARVWLDSEQLHPGDPVLPKIREGIEQANALVLLLSDQPGQFIKTELELAMAKGIRVIPVLLSDVPVPSELQGIQYIDLRENSEKGIQDLVQAVT